jgi:hypothetical protein
MTTQIKGGINYTELTRDSSLRWYLVELTRLGHIQDTNSMSMVLLKLTGRHLVGHLIIVR